MSTDGFCKFAVIGAGTMGSGIAAQIANAGHEVMLLDLPAREGADKGVRVVGCELHGPMAAAAQRVVAANGFSRPSVLPLMAAVGSSLDTQWELGFQLPTPTPPSRRRPST